MIAANESNRIGHAALRPLGTPMRVKRDCGTSIALGKCPEFHSFTPAARGSAMGQICPFALHSTPVHAKRDRSTSAES